jgi:hypothetical protein
MIAQRRACRDNFLYLIEYQDFCLVFDVWQGCPQRIGNRRKRELLNKFAKCIGARLSHLVLSGLIFCNLKKEDENYFHIAIFSSIKRTA